MCLLCCLSSCKKETFYERIDRYEKEGKSVLGYSSENADTTLYIVYMDGNKFFYDNMKEIIDVSPSSSMDSYSLMACYSSGNAGMTVQGKPGESFRYTGNTLESDMFSWTIEDVDNINKYGIYFKASCSGITSYFAYSFSAPEKLIQLGRTNGKPSEVVNGNLEFAGLTFPCSNPWMSFTFENSVLSIDEFSPIVEYLFNPQTCEISVSSIEVLGKKYQGKEMGSQINDLLSRIDDYYDSQQRNQILEQSITEDFLSECSKNFTKWEQYQNTYQYIVLNVYAIERGKGQYKYVVAGGISSYLYTNDINFTTLDYPKKVLMKAKIKSFDNSGLFSVTYEDCQLLYSGPVDN